VDILRIFIEDFIGLLDAEMLLLRHANLFNVSFRETRASVMLVASLFLSSFKLNFFHQRISKRALKLDIAVCEFVKILHARSIVGIDGPRQTKGPLKTADDKTCFHLR